MQSVYVIRRVHTFINGDDEYDAVCENLDQCYLNEESAINDMVKDLENTKADHAEECSDPKKDLHTHITSDYCLLNDDWTNETYEWYIDKLDVVD